MSVKWFDVLNEIIKTVKGLQNEMNELDNYIDKLKNEQNYKKLQQYINIRDDMTSSLIGICSMLKEV